MSDAQADLPEERLGEYRGLVKAIASDIKRRYRLRVDLDELEAAGLEGLVQAESAFDPGRNASFHTFAYYRVRGAIIDNCRRLGLMRRVYKKKARFEAAANAVMEVQTEHLPAGRDAATNSVWLAQTFDALAVSFTLATEPERVQSATASPESKAEVAQLTRRLGAALDRLTDDEQSVIRRYYLADERMTHIAEAMGMSPSWVSRVHRRALKKLRSVLERPPPKPDRPG